MRDGKRILRFELNFLFEVSKGKKMTVRDEREKGKWKSGWLRKEKEKFLKNSVGLYIYMEFSGFLLFLTFFERFPFRFVLFFPGLLMITLSFPSLNLVRFSLSLSLSHGIHSLLFVFLGFFNEQDDKKKRVGKKVFINDTNEILEFHC